MKICRLSLLLATALLVSPVQAFDLGGMLKDAVQEKAEQAVQEGVDNANSALKEAFPSLPDGVISVDSSQLGISKKNVVMYETEGCGYCKRARQFFKSNNIAYKSRNLDKSQSAQKEFRKLGARGVPVILVKNKRLTGWDEAKLKGLLKEAGYL